MSIDPDHNKSIVVIQIQHLAIVKVMLIGFVGNYASTPTPLLLPYKKFKREDVSIDKNAQTNNIRDMDGKNPFPTICWIYISEGLVVILLFVRDEFMTGDTTQGVGGYQF